LVWVERGEEDWDRLNDQQQKKRGRYGEGELKGVRRGHTRVLGGAGKEKGVKGLPRRLQRYTSCIRKKNMNYQPERRNRKENRTRCRRSKFKRRPFYIELKKNTGKAKRVLGLGKYSRIGRLVR